MKTITTTLTLIALILFTAVQAQDSTLFERTHVKMTAPDHFEESNP